MTVDAHNTVNHMADDTTDDLAESALVIRQSII